MRWFLIILVVAGFGYWWQHHTPAPQAAVATAPVAATTSIAAPAQAAPVAAPGQASWPRRNIDRAQAAVNAAKQTREVQ
jgi:hypothetical protein